MMNPRLDIAYHAYRRPTCGMYEVRVFISSLRLGSEIRGFSKQPSEFSRTNFVWVVDGEKNYDARIIKMKCDQA
ncbi:unnamed protein product [Boreogadus saida]